MTESISQRLKFFSEKDFSVLPLEALMAGTAGTMAALIELDIRAQSAAISAQNKKIQEKNTELTNLRGQYTGATGATRTTLEKDISTKESELDDLNTLSQNQTTRLQSLKDKYDELFTLISSFAKAQHDTSMHIVSVTG